MYKHCGSVQCPSMNDARPAFQPCLPPGPISYPVPQAAVLFPTPKEVRSTLPCRPTPPTHPPASPCPALEETDHLLLCAATCREHASVRAQGTHCGRLFLQVSGGRTPRLVLLARDTGPVPVSGQVQMSVPSQQTSKIWSQSGPSALPPGTVFVIALMR